MRLLLVAIALAFTALVGMGMGNGAPLAQVPPPFPRIYSGGVTVGGNPAPDGMEIVAFVGALKVNRVLTEGGRYTALAVGIPASICIGKTITFYAGDVQALETDVFVEIDILRRPDLVTKELALTFPRAPLSGAKTPHSFYYSGSVTVEGRPAPDGLEIVISSGDREVERVLTSGGRYSALAVGTPDDTYTGKAVTFAMGDEQAPQKDVFVAVDLLKCPDQVTKALDLTFARVPISVAKTPAFFVTPPFPGDPSVPGVPSLALLLGAVLVVVGVAGLRLLGPRKG